MNEEENKLYKRLMELISVAGGLWVFFTSIVLNAFFLDKFFPVTNFWSFKGGLYGLTFSISSLSFSLGLMLIYLKMIWEIKNE